MKIRPLNDRVLIKKDEELSKSSGGILLSSQAREKSNKGTIVAAGPGKALDDGRIAPMAVKVGDRVVFPTYAGSQTIKDGDVEFVFMNESELYGILEE